MYTHLYFILLWFNLHRPEVSVHMHMHVCTHRQEVHIRMYAHGLYWDLSHRSEVPADVGVDAVVHQVVPLAVDISLLHGHKQFEGSKARE